MQWIITTLYYLAGLCVSFSSSSCRLGTGQWQQCRHTSDNCHHAMVSIVSYSRPSLMIIGSVSQFHVYLPWGLNSVLNVKAVVAAFNQEKALVGAFSVITNLRIEFGWNFLRH